MSSAKIDVTRRVRLRLESMIAARTIFRALYFPIDRGRMDLKSLYSTKGNLYGNESSQLGQSVAFASGHFEKQKPIHSVRSNRITTQ